MMKFLKVIIKASIIYLIFGQITIASALPDEKRGLNWQSASSNLADDFKFGEFRAIVIGNNQYSDKNNVWKNLTTAVNDAENLAELLSRQYGFKDVVLLKNANRKKILHELKEMSKRVEVNDNVLVYYAGHGHLDEVGRRGYWIPSDVDGMDDSTFIRNSTIRDEINIIAEKTKHTLLLSDSCFSGSLLRGGNRGPTEFDRSQNYYKKVGSKRSVQVLTAGGNEYVDDNYRNSGHSPFTYFLINELKNNAQKYISLSEIATNIIKIVANNVDQTPEAGVLAGAGDALGEFIFVKVSFKDREIEVIASKPKNPVTATVSIETTLDAEAYLPAFRF